MMKHQAYATLPVQVNGPTTQQTTDTIGSNTMAPAQNATPSTLRLQQQQQQQQPNQNTHNPIRLSTLKAVAKRHSQQQRFVQHHHYPLLNQAHQQRPKAIRASEYRNLRQVVPSLRRQRDVGKMEVVTEAARYIDHLHKTLIERFVLCGIPESLKGKFK